MVRNTSDKDVGLNGDVHKASRIDGDLSNGLLRTIGR